MMAFGPETLQFLSALRANNSRAWFEANKETYRKVLKQPAEVFAAEMTGLLQSASGLEHEAKIFRIHRDLRFSKDKTPYNAHLHMSFAAPSDGPAAPSWMIGLEPEKLVLGAGILAFPGPILRIWRTQVSGSEGSALASIVADLESKGICLNPPDLKRVPPPYPADHPSAGLLRRKGLSAWVELATPSVAFGREGARQCLNRLLEFRPLFDWLRSVGEPVDF